MQTYDKDINAWANEQAQLLRDGHCDRLDIEHIAAEIEDVGKSEQRELASRMAVLLAHLLKWQYQPERAVTQAVGETGLDCFPDACPWDVEDEILDESWLPG